MTIHPDFPERPLDVGRWDLPDPYGDIGYALDQTKGNVTIGDIATVEEYDITSTDGKWAPGGSVGTELQMTLLGTLRDGRWFSLEAGNDYTGWGCMGDSADLYIGLTRDEVVREGLTAEGRNALGIAVTA